MGLEFGDIEMTPNTILDENYFNPIFQDFISRLEALEGVALVPILISGALTTGRKAIIKCPIAASSVEVSLSSKTYAAGAHIIANLYKGGEPSGGAGGTAMFTSGARPTLLTTNTTGVSAYVAADVSATLPLAAGDNVALDIEQADLGPVSNMLVMVKLIP